MRKPQANRPAKRLGARRLESRFSARKRLAVIVENEPDYIRYYICLLDVEFGDENERSTKNPLDSSCPSVGETTALLRLLTFTFPK